MLLTGSFQRSLDEKNRFSIPKSVRAALQDPAGNLVVYLAPGTDRSLVVYTEQTFAQLGEHLGQGPPNTSDIRVFSRLFYAQAQRVEVDRQGRVRIPGELAALAHLDREIVLLGVRDHLEIWDREHWDHYRDQKQPYYDEIAEGAFGASVGSVRNTDPSHPESSVPAAVRPR